MDWVEAAGYAASGLVFLTFCMKTLIPLRLMAIASNLAFIVYAVGANLTPVLILHAALLPLNVMRTVQQIKTYLCVRRVARGEANAQALVPLMLERLGPEGEVLFRKGDLARDIYYISSGEVEIPEIGKTLGPGQLFGEMGLFTPERTRTASAHCKTQCNLLVISEDDILRHCTNDPAFGLFLTKLIASRMSENQARLEDLMSRSAPQTPPHPPRAGRPEAAPADAPGRRRRGTATAHAE